MPFSAPSGARGVNVSIRNCEKRASLRRTPHGMTVVNDRIATTANSGTGRTDYHLTSNDRLAVRAMSSKCLFAPITGINVKLCQGNVEDGPAGKVLSLLACGSTAECHTRSPRFLPKLAGRAASLYRD
jgi:hypothetical protein